MSKEKLKQNVKPVGADASVCPNSRGITLIALIITIIVMLILVGVSVTVALNGGLFSTAQSAKTQTKEERDKEQNLANGKVEIGGVWYNSIEEYTKGNSSGEDSEPTVESITIDASTPGIVFKKGGETEITGENLTSVQLEIGDTVEYGDYIYTYTVLGTLHGWEATAIDKTKTTYGKLSRTIFGADLISMKETFSNCTLLEIAPEIPDTVKEIGWASMGYGGAFKGCTALKTAPEIPDSCIMVSGAFADCTSLEKAPIIPSTVVAMYYTFYNCTALTGEIEVNAGFRNDTSYAPGYNQCFAETVKDITLIGESDYLDELAATSTSGNVTVGTTNASND